MSVREPVVYGSIETPDSRPMSGSSPIRPRYCDMPEVNTSSPRAARIWLTRKVIDRNANSADIDAPI